jgi:protein TonB
MSSSPTRIHHWPLAIIIALIVNALLFAGLPLLTQVQERREGKPYESPILLTAHRPPKPPTPEKDRRKIKERELKKSPKKLSVSKRTSAKPKIDIPRFEFARVVEGAGSGMEIVSPGRIKEIKDIKRITAKIGFELSEVDTPPRILRKFNPVYPFGAKRQGLTGKVIIRCLIGTDGKAGKLKVLVSKPEGIFDEAALAAVERWLFKPGILGGEAVPTWVRIPITFELN